MVKNTNQFTPKLSLYSLISAEISAKKFDTAVLRSSFLPQAKYDKNKPQLNFFAGFFCILLQKHIFNHMVKDSIIFNKKLGFIA